MAELCADCANCFGLCCVGLTFTASSDFPVDKPAGTPCPNLTAAHRCTVHDTLRERGYVGCVSYECIGAGQRVSQQTFGGRDWRWHSDIAAEMFAALPVMRQLHELLAYLADAAARPAARGLHETVRGAAAEVESYAAAGPRELLETDLDELRTRIGPLLREVSVLVRAGFAGPDRAGADLAGADLHGADLRGADLRGGCLIAADLRSARLNTADLIGADLRAANLSGADLTDALYLTQAQLNSARGDLKTAISRPFERPGHWT